MSNKDIFGWESQLGNVGVLHAENVIMRVGTTGGTVGKSYLVQSIVIRYGRPIQFLAEVGSGTAYGFTGPSQGTCSISKYVGAKTLSDALGEPGTGMWVTPTSGSTTDNRIIGLYDRVTKKLLWKLAGCIITSLNASVSAQGGPVGESAEIMFGELYWGDN